MRSQTTDEYFRFKKMRGDLSVIGPNAAFPRYVVSGGTAIVAGEPVHCLGTLSSGVINTNTYVLAAADTPVIAAITTSTHKFGGVALKDSENAAAGTTLTQYLNCAMPVPFVGRIRGKAETAGDMDTASELAGLIGDAVLIDYSATGAADGGQLYTIKTAASADTSGLEIVGGNTALGTLDVVVHGLAFRVDIS